jgi:branched-subunit amino acid transport protein AzlD
MSGMEIYLAIIVMAIANYLTRVIPFLFFAKKEPPSFVLFIEKNFPPIIMTILIFYTLANVDFVNEMYGIKEFSSILLTAFLHIRYNNYLVSIFVGTFFYMALVQFI